jgi:cysteine desulfurase
MKPMLWKKRVYLDAAAGAASNPSSPHEEGRVAKQILEDARVIIARLVEVQADDVIFTSGATESNAIAILGHIRALREAAGRPDAVGRNNIHVLYLPSAHASIVENMKMLASEGVVVEPLPIKDARVDTEALALMLRKDTALVSMDAVCGETGVIWNTREVAEVLRTHSRSNASLAPSGLVGTSQPVASTNIAPAVLHVDASQAPLTEKITRAHFGADLITFDGSKVGALRGIGVLIAHRTIPLAPLYRGGGQERGIRSGSESPELASAFATALSAAAKSRDQFRTSAERDRELLVSRITETIPGVYIQEGRSQAPHILNLALPGRDTDYLVALLDEAGFAVSTRSACETDSEEGSRAVLALTGDVERARATLRISWNESITSRSLVRFAKALSRAVAFIDKGSQR